MNLTNRFIDDILHNFPNCFFWYRLDAKGAKPIPFPGNVVNDITEKIDFSMIKEKDTKYAVSFTPNGDYYYNQNKRTIANAWRVYCIAIDSDDGEWKRESFPLEPSIVVKTKRWEHVYWLLSTPVQYSSVEKDYKNIMKTLVDNYGADSQAADISRMFRLPWTHHKKDMDNVVKTEVIKYNPEIRYTIDDFLKYCEAETVNYSTFQPSKWRLKKHEIDNFDRINDVNVLDVLAKFENIDERRWQLSIWWEWTWWYKYWKERNYLKSFSWDKWWIRPSWWPFAVAKHFMQKTSDVFQFFKDEFWIRQDIVLSIPKIQSQDKNVDAMIENDILQSYTWSQKELNISDVVEFDEDFKENIWWNIVHVALKETVGEINYKFSYLDEMIICDWVDWDIIVDWFFRCVWVYENNWIMYYVLYVKKNGMIMTKVVDRLHSSARLEYWLSYMGLTFNWTRAQAKWLISIIHKTTNKMVFINKAGIYPSWLIVNKKWEYILSHAWTYYYCNIDNNSSGKDGNDSQNIFSVWEYVDKKKFMDIVGRVCECHNPNITFPLFIIYSMGMLAHVFKDLWVKIPWALVYGNPWSGKSETIMNIQKIIGIPNFNIQWDSSAFAFDYIAKHYLPIKIAEYDRVKQKFDVDTFLKNSYDGESKPRGTKEQAIISYENNALFIVDWENRSMNSAVYSRNFAFHFTSRDLKERTKIYHKMISDGYLKKNILSYIINNKDKLIAGDFHSKMIHYENKIMEETETYDIQEKGRMLKNYWVVMAYLDCMDLMEYEEYIHQAFLNQLDMFWDSKVDKTIKQFCMKAMFDKTHIMMNGNYLQIPVYIDYFRSDTNKADDAQGNVMVANSILAPESHKNDTDMLHVSHTYMQWKKNLHSIYNNVLNSITKYVSFWPESVAIVKSIRIYAETNWFTTQPFYDDTTLSTW